MIDPIAIRREMTELGWISHDKMTWMGWGSDQTKYGYNIWFERWDWHGRRCDRVCYHARTADLTQIPETVRKAADLAKKAWRNFKFVPPIQTADGFLDDGPNIGIWRAAGVLNKIPNGVHVWRIDEEWHPYPWMYQIFFNGRLLKFAGISNLCRSRHQATCKAKARLRQLESGKLVI